MRISEVDNQDLQMMIYTLQSLCYKCISIPDAVRMSLTYLVHCYGETDNMKYIDIAILQLCALADMGMLVERDMELYEKVCLLAGWGEWERLKNIRFCKKKVKANKSQVRAMIRKWMPSADNPMTIGTVVDDIIDKVKNHKVGQYYYCYERKALKNKDGISSKDIYKLVIEEDQSFFLDLKHFKCYTFQI